jgi:hypothetical protein
MSRSRTARQWPVHGSKRIRVTVTSDYNDPDVQFTLFQDEARTTEWPGVSWPLTMAKVEDEDAWEVVVPCGAIGWSVEDRVYDRVSFDDGAENCLHLERRGVVVRVSESK